MAQFINNPIAGIDESSEVQVAAALKQLSDDWHVIYSVAWQGVRRNKEGDGEADFVLISKNAGLIVLEVKGGEEILIDKGQWKSKRHNDGIIVDIKNPYEQATDSKSTLYKWLRNRVPFNIPTMHGVVFPGARTPENMGPAATPKITIDTRDMHDMPTAIGRLVSHWKMPCKLTDKQVEKIIELLAPTTAIRRSLADEAYDAEHELIKLTDEQKRAFSGLKRTPKAVIYGGPGTGKTLLASEKAHELSNNGARTLLVCYNALLAQELSASKQLKNVKVSTFHSLCLAEARKKNKVPNSPISDNWWENEAPYYLVEGYTETEDKFDAIIVDEGQDFSDDWLQALFSILLQEDLGNFYIFADANQKLWPRSWKPQNDWLIYELTINCRNTHPIASKVADVVTGPIIDLGAKGPKPKWSVLSKKANVSSFVCDVVADLLDDGFEATDITVLCENAEFVKVLENMVAGNECFCRYGGKGVVVETIARFKGLDSAAIIAVLSETNQVPDINAYVAFSRARTYLHVIGPNSRQKTTNWLNS